MTERDLQNAIMRALGRGDTRVFRNNVGTGWQGQIMRLADGAVLIRNPRPLHAGLCKGSSDLIGWRSILITPDMVGSRIAAFVAAEVKSKRGRVTEPQQRFIDAVRAAGGIAAVVRSVVEAEEL